MTEQEWNASVEPGAMIEWRLANGGIDDKVLRLWVEECRAIELRSVMGASADYPNDLANSSGLHRAVECWSGSSTSIDPKHPGLRAQILRDLVPYRPCWVTGRNLPVPWFDLHHRLRHRQAASLRRAGRPW